MIACGGTITDTSFGVDFVRQEVEYQQRTFNPPVFVLDSRRTTDAVLSRGVAILSVRKSALAAWRDSAEPSWKAQISFFLQIQIKE